MLITLCCWQVLVRGADGGGLSRVGATHRCVAGRFLYAVLMEAGCLEWALLIAVLLRDSISVVRVVNTASLTDTPIEMVGRMREGLSYLQLWADTER